MFDIDQDVEFLAVIQAAATYRRAVKDAHIWQVANTLDAGLKLDDALEAVVARYGTVILTYDVDAGA